MTGELVVDYRMFKTFCQDPYLFYHRYILADLPEPELTGAQLQQLVLGQLVQGRTLDELDGLTVLDFPDRRTKAYKDAAAEAVGHVLLKKEVQPIEAQAAAVRSSPLYRLFEQRGVDHASYSRALGDQVFLHARPTLSCLELDQCAIVRSTAQIHQAPRTARSAWWNLAAQFNTFVSNLRCFILIVSESQPYSTRVFEVVHVDGKPPEYDVPYRAARLVESIKQDNWQELQHRELESL